MYLVVIDWHSICYGTWLPPWVIDYNTGPKMVVILRFYCVHFQSLCSLHASQSISSCYKMQEERLWAESEGSWESHFHTVCLQLGSWLARPLTFKATCFTSGREVGQAILMAWLRCRISLGARSYTGHAIGSFSSLRVVYSYLRRLSSLMTDIEHKLPIT